MNAVIFATEILAMQSRIHALESDLAHWMERALKAEKFVDESLEVNRQTMGNWLELLIDKNSVINLGAAEKAKP